VKDCALGLRHYHFPQLLGVVHGGFEPQHVLALVVFRIAPEMLAAAKAQRWDP
jgi:hypothetical protein